MRKLIILSFIALCYSAAGAQILHPVHWSYGAKRAGKDEALILLKATIDEGWHIYSVNQEDGGPVKTAFIFSPGRDYELVGTVIEPKPVVKFETTFNVNVKYFESAVVFQQKITLRQAQGDKIVVKGKVNFMVCNYRQCLPPEDVEFTIPVK